MILQNIKDRIKNFLNIYLDTSGDKQDEQVTIEEIRSGIEFKGSNVWILIFAIFIASLGLNTNSTAVIIGAMLISPLMGPIMGIGLGLGIYDFELIKKSFRNLAIATLFSVITSTVYFFISPLREAHSELLSRTSPTIYDVLIAFFGGLAGIVALASKQKGNVIPGVAIATALMPPLCTAGFGLANGNMYYFMGAFYLYCINSVFIAFATTLGVKFMKFPKKQFVDPKREEKVQRIVYTLLFVTMVPSFFITYDMIRSNYFQSTAYQFVNQEFNFENTQILSKDATIDKGEKIIRVSLIGKEVPQDTILMIENRMKTFGLNDARLIVSQGYNGEEQKIDINSLNSMMFQDIYKDNQNKIASQAKEIDRLKNEMKSYEEYDSIGIRISPELKVLFPDIEEFGVSKLVFNELDSTKLYTETLAVIQYKEKIMPHQEQKKFEEWLKARLGVDKIHLVIE